MRQFVRSTYLYWFILAVTHLLYDFALSPAKWLLMAHFTSFASVRVFIDRDYGLLRVSSSSFSSLFRVVVVLVVTHVHANKLESKGRSRRRTMITTALFLIACTCRPSVASLWSPHNYKLIAGRAVLGSTTPPLAWSGSWGKRIRDWHVSRCVCLSVTVSHNSVTVLQCHSVKHKK